MFQMRLENVISAIVSHHLLESAWSGDDQALYLAFDLRLYSDGERFQQSRGLHLLYHQREGHQTVSVFSAVSSSPFTKIEEIKEWKHQVSHDSEWVRLSLFSSLYFEMAERINLYRIAENLEEIAAIEMIEYCSFAGIASPMLRWVRVSVSMDPEDSSHYRRKVSLL